MTIEADEIITRVKGSLDIGDASHPQNNVRPHLEWEARQMVSHLTPDKLTTLELAGLIAVLHSAHARVLGGPTSSQPTFTVIPGEQPPEFRKATG